VEATKKTSTTRAALLVVAALSMLLSGLFIATASRSDATPPPACPDGFNLTADQKNCFQNAVITKADNPNSCEKGILTPDGTKCYVAARVIPQEGTTECPAGYSPDDSLNKMCARFEPALQNLPTCPTGASGVAGACYILVAKGPAGTPTCDVGGVLTGGTTCVFTGAAPTPGAGTCPVSTTVFLEGGVCFQVISGVGSTVPCAAPYVMLGTACKVGNPFWPQYEINPTPANQTLLVGWTCPTVPAGSGGAITGSTHVVGGVTKIESCSYAPAAGATTCTAAADIGFVNGQCRQSVAVVPGAANCAAGFGNIGGKCIRTEAPIPTPASCPRGSSEWNVSTGLAGAGECRKPVADAAGTYYCKSPEAALNGKSCVYTTGFFINPAETRYKCDEGLRTVIGSGSSAFGDGSTVRVICILGDSSPNVVEGPSCLQGVLSTDNLYCIVPRIDAAPAAAAPVPSFTG